MNLEQIARELNERPFADQEGITRLRDLLFELCAEVSKLEGRLINHIDHGDHEAKT